MPSMQSAAVNLCTDLGITAGPTAMREITALTADPNARQIAELFRAGQLDAARKLAVGATHEDRAVVGLA